MPTCIRLVRCMWVIARCVVSMSLRANAYLPQAYDVGYFMHGPPRVMHKCQALIAAMFRAYGQCLCCMHPFGEFPVFIGRTHEVLRGFLVWCFVLFRAIPGFGFERTVAVPVLLLVRDVARVCFGSRPPTACPY